jgi:hypothetical protein
MPFNGEPGRIRTLSYMIWKHAPLASRDSDSWLETNSSIGGSGETRTPKGFNPSRFQDDVLSRFASLPLKTSLGVEPRTSSFAAKTHAAWIEIIRYLMSKSWFPSFDWGDTEPSKLRRKSSRVLVTCAGLEPAIRQCERLFARPLRVARRGVDCRNRTRVIWLEARCLSHSAKPTFRKLEPRVSLVSSRRFELRTNRF